MGFGRQLPKFAEEAFSLRPTTKPLALTAHPPEVADHTRSTADEADRGRTTAAQNKRRLHPLLPARGGSLRRDNRADPLATSFNRWSCNWFLQPQKRPEAPTDQPHRRRRAVLKALDLPYRVLELCTGDLASPRPAPLIWRCGCPAPAPIGNLQLQQLR